MKGTPSHGRKNNKKNHIRCRRCGKNSYHKSKRVCSYCGFGGTAKLKDFTWSKKTRSGKRKN